MLNVPRAQSYKGTALTPHPSADLAVPNAVVTRPQAERKRSVSILCEMRWLPLKKTRESI